MTHRYSLLVGATILPGQGEPPRTAIAWAEGIVLALGTDDQIRAISRGDSELFDLRGAFVVPLGADDMVAWPPLATLEIGGPADLVILSVDPRDGRGEPSRVVGVIRGGHVVRGSLPGG
jgi:hypothetical protein